MEPAIIYDESFIDGEGVKQMIYTCQQVGDDWMAYANEMALQNYNSVYQFEYPEDMQIQIYSIGSETYYAYEIWGSRQRHQDLEKLEKRQRELSEALISCFEEQGIRFLPLDEIEELIANQKQKLGIAMEWCEEKELEWEEI